MSVAALAHYAWQGDFDHGVAKVICPFHEETAPSMWVYVQQASAYCFGCGWTGSVVKMVSQLESCNQIKAMLKLFKWSRKHKLDTLDLTKPQMFEDAESKEPRDPSKSYLAGMPSIVDSESRAEYYAYGRGFKPETLTSFDVRVNERSEWSLVIPIKRNGELVAWQSRSLDERKDKYHYIYGSKPSLLMGGEPHGKVVIVTEGYLDMMMAWQHLQMLGGRWLDVKVCTPLSWLMRPKQAQQVDCRIAVLAFDNDKRGRDGVEVAIGLLPRMVQFDWSSGAADVGSLDVAQFKREMIRALRRDDRG